MNYKTNELKEGTEIYYTGDMANNDGFGVIGHVRANGEVQYQVKMEDGRSFYVHHLSFSEGPGRRFMTKDEWRADRKAKIAAFNKWADSLKERAA